MKERVLNITAVTSAVVAVALILSGCGQASRFNANLTGVDKKCVDGVTYLQFPSGVVIQRDVNDKIVACK